MKTINNGKDLEEAIEELKTASQQQQRTILQRFGNTRAVLATAWTLFPWSSRKGSDQMQINPNSASLSVLPEKKDRQTGQPLQ